MVNPVYTQHEGAKPNPIDASSSSTKVYLHKNLREETRQDYGGREYKTWVYEEAVLTHDEFQEFMAYIQEEGHAQNEDAICELSETTEESIAALEQAICDLSEEIGG